MVIQPALKSLNDADWLQLCEAAFERRRARRQQAKSRNHGSKKRQSAYLPRLYVLLRTSFQCCSECNTQGAAEIEKREKIIVLCQKN